MSDLSSNDVRRLLHMRGGCRCQDPGAAPPCGACTDPLTDEELADLAERREVSEATFKRYEDARAELGYGGPGTGMLFKVWDGCDSADQLDMARQMEAGVRDARLAAEAGDW